MGLFSNDIYNDPALGGFERTHGAWHGLVDIDGLGRVVLTVSGDRKRPHEASLAMVRTAATQVAMLRNDIAQALFDHWEPYYEAEVDEALKRLAARFETRDAMQKELAAEGIDSEKELRLRIGARIQQQKYVESRIAPSIAVNDEEARAWHAAHATQLQRPERLQARHVFLATLERDAEEARATLQRALDELLAQRKDFATLATELSDDPRSKASGGDLGWLTCDRLPADFAAPLFALAVNRPTLLRTKIGWHLVEVTGRKPAEPRGFEECRAEVVAALQAVKRREATRAFRTALRSQEGRDIEVFTDMVRE
jgi:parvulin-like peptidyl-prolyl isomerase